MVDNKKVNFLINIAYYFLIAIIVYVLIKFLFAYLFPLIIGTVITIVVQKPASIISYKLKIRKGYCALALVIIEKCWENPLETKQVISCIAISFDTVERNTNG